MQKIKKIHQTVSEKNVSQKDGRTDGCTERRTDGQDQFYRTLSVFQLFTIKPYTQFEIKAMHSLTEQLVQ